MSQGLNPALSASPRELIGPSAISARLDELAAQIEADFSASPSIAFIAVACGAMVFSADLMRRIRKPMTLDLVFAKSYVGTESVGEVVSRVDLRYGIEGRDVLLVDDILDSGRTLLKLGSELKSFNPASLRSCVLLDKPSRRAVDVKADYVGFAIPDVFVVGYGLDYDGYLRNLPFVGSL